MPDKITPRLIKARLPAPGEGRGYLADSEVQGLELRGDRSRAAWTLRVRVEGQRRRITLGPWPAMDPDAAREAARVWIGRAAGGADMAEALAKRRARAGGLTLDALLALYGERTDMRTAVKVSRSLRSVFARLLSRPVETLTRADLMGVISAYADRHPTSGDRSLREMRAVMAWASDDRRPAARRIASNPLAGVRAGQAPARDHVPTLDEMRLIYRAAGDLGAPFGPLVRVMMLTAQRRGEVAGMRAEQLDLDAAIWRLPASLAKNGAAFDVPLAPAAVAILRGLDGQGYVFTTTKGRRPVSGFSVAARRLRGAVDKLAEAEGVEPVRAFVWHDWRRGFATTMAEAGEPAHIVDRALNHRASSTSTTIQRIYNRAHLLKPRRDLAERWGAHLGA